MSINWFQFENGCRLLKYQIQPQLLCATEMLAFINKSLINNGSIVLLNEMKCMFSSVFLCNFQRQFSMEIKMLQQPNFKSIQSLQMLLMHGVLIKLAIVHYAHNGMDLCFTFNAVILTHTHTTNSPSIPLDINNFNWYFFEWKKTIISRCFI